MKPFVRTEVTPESRAKLLRDAQEQGEEMFRAVKEFLARNREIEVWKNDVYQVVVRRVSFEAKNFIWLSIRRLDRQCVHDWRDLQQIKNLLVGPENEAVELYPAESRLVDSANQYHLWVAADPRFRWPFGFTTRLVMDTPLGGSVQRRFDSAVNCDGGTQP